MEPFEVLEFSHGICGNCLKNRKWSPATRDTVQKLARFHRELIEMGRTGDLTLAPEALQKGISLGIRPLDFLVGMVQPALYEIGSLWECGQMSIAEEHRFTVFASRLIDLCHESLPQSYYRQSRHPEIVLTCAPNNYHFLGLRIVELWLISANHHVFTVFPGIPTDEILKLIHSLRPRYLGISISVLDQIGFLPELERALQASQRYQTKMKLTLLIGGAAIKGKKWNSFHSERIAYCREISELDIILNQQGAVKESNAG